MAGTYAVVITATGRDGKADSSYFNWIIALVPALTSPGSLRSTIGGPISQSIIGVGGLLPVRWSATGLPAGLAINTTTGVVTGTPTAVQAAKPVVVTLTDSGVPPRTATTTFNWQVFSHVALYDPGPQTIVSNTDVGLGSFAFAASGGATPYLFRTEDLPTSLTLVPTTGAVYGDIIGTRFIVTVFVTDSLGDVDSMTVLLDGHPERFRPAGVDAEPGQSGPEHPVNTTPAALTAVAAGGSTPYTWTATDLPTGLVLSTGGVISGKPTVKGSYVVTFTVTDRYGRTAVMMFTWTVT